MKHTRRVIHDLDGVESLRPLWEQWQTHPNSDLDHFMLICRQRRSVLRPCVIVVSQHGEPRAIVAARVETGQVAPSIGYFTPVRFPVVRLAVLYQGLLGQIDDAVAGEILAGLDAELLVGEVDVVELYHLPEGSPLQRALARTRRDCRDERLAWSVHWDMTLPREPGGLLKKMKSKHRSWVRRKTRDLEAAFPGRCQFRAFSPGDDLAPLYAELEAVARLTYQRGLGVDFMDNAEYRERFELFNRRGMLRAWMLHVDGIPRAYTAGICYGDTFHFSMTGYDPAFRRFEVGNLLFVHMVDELVRSGVERFDFGLGDADYKQRYGDHSWREATPRLYRRNMKGLMINATTAAVGAATRSGRAIAQHFGVVNRLKNAWRRRLAGSR